MNSVPPVEGAAPRTPDSPSGFRLAAAVLRPGTMIDHFRVMRLIGRGGMGEVYLVRDTKLGRRAALKVVNTDHVHSKEAIDAFLFEARTTARFNHPNIVTLHAVGEYEGRPYVALEYLEGQNLRERLLERRPSLSESIRISLAIARALQAAHEGGVLHLDLKPENVVIPMDGRPRVVDFGLAKTFRVADGDAIPVDEEVATTGWGTPDYVAPEQWRYEPTSKATDIWAFGVILFELCTGKVPYTEPSVVEKGRAICSSASSPKVEERADVPPALADLVGACLIKDPEQRPVASDIVERLQALLTPGRALSDEDSPFRGLLPFTQRDAGVFFGRDPEVAAFVERLRHQPILSVVGASGSGKSSFVQAGVIPRLHEQERWVVISLRPGLRPFFTLAERLRRVHEQASPPREGQAGSTAAQDRSAALIGEGPVEDLATALYEAPHKLALALRALADARRAKVLLIIEQLEEVFTIVDDVASRRRFVQAVCSAADDALEPVRVVLTVRDDFLGRLAMSVEAREALTQVVMIESLGARALTQTLLRPIEAVGYRFEDPQIASEMTAAVAGRPGSLPLLQFSAQRMWDLRDRERRVILRAAYEQTGGVEGALARHADGLLDAMSDGERVVARDLLLRLVSPERTRKLVAKTDLLDGLGARAIQVFDHLTQGRLIAVKSPRHSHRGARIELVHEALIHKWETLGRWLDESREEHAFAAQLEQAAALWVARERRPEELWQGDALAHALRMRERFHGELTPTAAGFLELAMLRENGRQRRRRFLVAAVISTLLCVAIGAVGIAIFVADKEHEALEQRDRAEQQRSEALRGAARAALEQGDTLQARARLRAAIEVQDSAGARMLWWRLQQDRRLWTKQLGSLVYAVDYAPDGKSVVAGCQDNAIYLIDTETRDTRVLRGSDDQVYAVAFSPDSRRIASATWSGRVDIWDALSGQRISAIAGHETSVRTVAFSPDGTRLASGSAGGQIKLWNTASGELEREHPVGHRVAAISYDPMASRLAIASDGGVEVWDFVADTTKVVTAKSASFAVAFGPTGKTVAGAGTDAVIHVWDVASGEPLHALRGHTASVRGLAFSSSGELLASGSYDKTVRVWDLRSGGQMTLSDHTAGLESVAFGPDDDHLVSAGRDRTLRLWSLRDPTQRAPDAGHTAGVYRVKYSPDGRLIASASGDQTVRIWDADTGDGIRTLVGHTGGVDSLAFSASGEMLASGSVDQTVRVWDVGTGVERRVLTGHAERVSGVAFDPSGALVASAARDGTLRVFEVYTGAAVEVLYAHNGGAYGIDFSRDGKWLVSGGADGRVVLWDASSYSQVREFAAHRGGVNGVVFNPDGRTIASGGSDNMVRIWNREGGEHSHLGPHAGRVYWLDYDPSGTRIGAPASDGSVTIWDLPDRSSIVLRGHDQEVNSVGFSPEGTALVTGGDDGTVRVWDAQTGRPKWRAPVLLDSPPLLFSHRGWIDPRTGRVVTTPRTLWREAVERRALHAVTPPASSLICIHAYDSKIEVWDRTRDVQIAARSIESLVQVASYAHGCLALDGRTVWKIDDSGEMVALSLDHSPTAASASGDAVWVAAGTEVVGFDANGAVIGRFEAGVSATAVVNTGSRVLVGYRDGNVDVWTLGPDGAARAHGLEQTPASKPVRMLAGPADTVVIGYANGEVGFWSVVDGTPLTSARLHGQVVHLLREGALLFAASDLGDHLTWNLDALHADYCALLEQIWVEVPIHWTNARAARLPRPTDHRCRNALRPVPENSP